MNLHCNELDSLKKIRYLFEGRALFWKRLPVLSQQLLRTKLCLGAFARTSHVFLTEYCFLEMCSVATVSRGKCISGFCCGVGSTRHNRDVLFYRHQIVPHLPSERSTLPCWSCTLTFFFFAANLRKIMHR